MNITESFVFKFLNDVGLEPKKNRYDLRDKKTKGLPDFKCKNNVYVEVKSTSDDKICFSSSQFIKFKELLEKKNRILIAIFPKNAPAFNIFELTLCWPWDIITKEKSNKNMLRNIKNNINMEEK